MAYTERVNLAIDYVVSNLGQAGGMRLEKVSSVAMLSPFHFHRVFQAMVGQTLADFVKRLRLERALVMMAHARSSPRPSLTTIALACGFSSSSDFSRSFKQRFGAAPSAFDIKAWRESHRAELEAMMPQTAERLHLKELPARARGTGSAAEVGAETGDAGGAGGTEGAEGGGGIEGAGHNPDGFKVRIRDLPARTVAYIRVLNPYGGGGDAVVKAVERLMSWAERNGLADGQWLGYQWENPEITALEDCQYHVAVETTSNRKESKQWEGEIGRFRFPRMVVAQVEVRGGIDLELRALQWLYGEWLPRSGYVPDDQPCFEAWIGQPFAHGMEHFELYAQLPVRRG